MDGSGGSRNTCLWKEDSCIAVGNTGTRLIGNTEFYGGLSTDPKIGIENSYADAECLDVRKSPGQMTVLPQPRESSWSRRITGLVVAMEQSKDGNLWAIDEKGKLYKIDEDNVVSVIDDTASSSGFGLAYFQIADGLYYTDGGHTLYNYGKILNPTGQTVTTNSFATVQDESEYIVSQIVVQTKDQQVFYQTNGNARSSATNYTVVPTSVSENNADKALFLPAISPLAQIGVKFTALGSSGSVKLVIHDEANNIVASSNSIDYSSMSTSGYVYFDVRPNPSAAVSPKNQFMFTPWTGDTIESGSVLHIHIVATASGFRASTIDSGSMYTGLNMVAKGFTLAETFNKKHPMAVYDKIYIGNGQYVASLANSPLNTISDTWYLPHQLRLDDGYEVCSIATTDEYLIVGAEKTNVSSRRGFQKGRIYFWDFQSQGPCFYIDCNMGAPQSMINHDNIVYIVIAGALYAYTGGKELVKVRTLKGTDTEYSGSTSVTEVYPNMMAIRREIMLCGFPSTTTAQTIRYGIHGWGSVDKNYPNCWTFNYRIPGNYEYNTDLVQLRLGCVYNFNDALFYSYEIISTDEETEVTTTEEYLGVVDNDSGTVDSFYYHSLVYDGGAPILEKDALRVGIKFDPLPDGCTITPIYRVDDGEWIEGPDTATAGDTVVKAEVGFGNTRMHEFQFGFKGTTQGGSQTPVIKQVAAEIRILDEEMKF